MNPLALLRALRPSQWSKNLFVLVALVFAAGEQQSHVEGGALQRVLLACAAFCCAASAVYLLNDVLDVEKDRAHPEKRTRPIAAGLVSVPLALAAALVLALAGLALGWVSTAGPSVAWVVGAYLVLNVAYGIRLKSVVLVDAFCIAAGFLLRVQAGGLAAGVGISHWAFLCMLFLALFLALAKRRAELALLGDDSHDHRPALRHYTLQFLDPMVSMLAGCTVITYTMYTVDHATAEKFGADNHLVWTVPFVVFGVGRYMNLLQSGRGGDDPTRMLLGKDPLFLVNTLLWGGMVAWVILR
jgi:4-hydroxybenzoate polyprenyltransferase